MKNTVLSTGLAFFLLAMVLASTTVSVAGETQGFASLGTYGVLGTPQIDGIPQVTINGTDFVVNGEPYIFRGVNIEFAGLNIHYFGSPLPTLSQSTFDLLKSWKVNILRISLHMEAANPQYGVWNEDFFTLLDQLYDYAETHQIYLMIVPIMSYKVGPKYGGSGHPDWLFENATGTGQYDSDGPCALLYEAIVNKDPQHWAVEEAIRQYYQRIATMSRDRNIVMGYDIYNEPQYRDIPGYSRESATIFYETLADYITAIDSSKLMAVENNFISTRKPNIPNLFSSPHTYITQNAGDTVSIIKNRVIGYNGIGSGNTWQVPVLSGEWWAPLVGDGNPAFTEATAITQTMNFCTAFEELGWSWTLIRHLAQIPNLHPLDSVEQVYFDYFANNQPIPTSA